MAASNPPINAVAFRIYVSLQDMLLPGSFKANPTLAAGDVKVSKDGGAFANLTTLPAVTPAAGIAVQVDLSGTEMTGDNIFVQFIDQTNPKEWADFSFVIQTWAAAPATAANIWDRLTSALTTSGSIGKLIVDNLDVVLSTRLASSSYTAPPSAAVNAAAVWDYLTSAATTVGSLGKRIADNVDAAISTRSTYAGGDTAGVTTLLSRLSAARAGYLDNLSAGAVALEVSVQSVLSKLLKYVQLMLRKDSAIATDNATELSAINANGGSGAGAFVSTTDSQEALRDNVGTAGAALSLAKTTNITGFNDISSANVKTQADQALADVGLTTTITGRVDVAVSTRLASGSYTSPPSAATNAAAVWDYLTSAATTVGSLGKLLVDNINATIGSRSSHTAADIWAVATRLLTAGTNIVLAKGTGVTGFNDISSANVKTQADQALADAGVNTTTMARLDVAVSTRLASGSYTTPPTAASNAAAVWDYLTSAGTTIGSYGKLVVDYLNAAVSSRSSHSAADIWAVGTRTLTGIASGIIASAELNNIADALLKRDMSAVSGEATRSPLNALRKLMNKVGFSGGNLLTVYKEDDSTPAYTQGVVTDASQDPIKSLDTV